MNIRYKIGMGLLFSYAVMIFTVIVSIFPIVWVVVSSFKTNKAILSEPFALPTSISFQAYADVFTQYNFLRFFSNSLFIATTATVIAVFIYAHGVVYFR